MVSLAGVAAADELDDRRDEIRSELAESRQNLEESSQELAKAKEALADSQRKLSAAETKLADAEHDTDEAKKRDVEMATQLKRAEAELEQAKQNVTEVKADIDEQKTLIGEEVRHNTQMNAPLLSFAAFFSDDTTTADVNRKLQFATMMYDSSAASMDRLTELRFKLEAAEQAQTEATERATQARQDAAAQLVETKQLEARANDARDEVAGLVGTNARAKAAAADEVAKEEARISELEAEDNTVSARIKARIEAEKKAAADKAAAEKAAAEKAAAASKKSASRPSTSRPRPSKHATPKSSSSSSSQFIMPVSGRISSVYGMRFHPVLKRWKLHDGLDIAAPCGTPMRAAASGVVTDRYFNAGYGNRLMISHGEVNGRYVTTGYNHATRYVVGVGERVSQGEVIGYVGTTGYSTGCHLHLMVWENGSTVNPQSRWF